MQPKVSAEVERLRQQLLVQGSPRLQMLLLVSLAGLGAFLTSAALLSAGLESMGARYAIAAAAGYGVFLGLVRVWIAVQRRRGSIEPDLPIDLPSGGEGGGPDSFGGGGGGFGGGGASGSFGPAEAPASDSASGLLEIVPDGLDEGWPIAVVLGLAVAAVAGLVAVGMVIYASPVLFAEVLLDAAVVGAVYRRARRHGGSYWLHGVLRRTWLPALAVCLLVAVSGLVLQASFPEAHSIGAVLGR